MLHSTEVNGKLAVVSPLIDENQILCLSHLFGYLPKLHYAATLKHLKTCSVRDLTHIARRPYLVAANSTGFRTDIYQLAIISQLAISKVRYQTIHDSMTIKY